MKRQLSQVTELRTLQEFDDEAATYRLALEEIERKLLGSEVLEAARERFNAAEIALAEIRKAQRSVDGEIEGLSAKIEPEEKRLYGGSVKNPKELGNIQHEVELLKQHKAEFEEQLLEVLQRLEAAEAEHAAAQLDLTQQESLRSREERDLKKESKRLTEQLSQADAKREAQKTKIVPRYLPVYEDIRRRRGGVAVARIAGGNCGACRVSVPEAIRRKAFTADQLALCPNCERILYVG